MLRLFLQDGHRAPHKPLLTLLALGRLATSDSSAVPWSVAEHALAALIAEFGQPSRTGRAQSAAYPFTRLRSDGIGELDADVPMDKITPLSERNVTSRLTLPIESTLRASPRQFDLLHSGPLPTQSGAGDHRGNGSPLTEGVRDVPDESWDALVIGAGLGGLTTAAYLTVNGMRALVLEHNMVAGGSSQVFRRRGMWEFDVGVHYVGQCNPDGPVSIALRGLGLADRIEWRPLDADGYTTLVYPDLTFRVPRGWDNYLARLLETFPDEKRGLRLCIGLLRRMSREIMERGVPQGNRELMLAPVRMPATVFGSAVTLAQVFDLCRLSPAARAVIAGEHGDYACPPSRTAAAYHAGFIHHYLEAGGFYPKGGGQVLAAHLIDVIQSHGGAVHTKADVDRILLEDGRVAGVQLRSGDILRAPVVVSNADPKRTYLELVGREHLPARTIAKVEKYRMALPIFSVYLGLNLDLADRTPNTIIWASPSYDIEGLYRAAYRGGVPDPLPIFMTSASVKDPGNPYAAPPGHSTLEVMAIVPRDDRFWLPHQEHPTGTWNTRHPEYLATKEALTQALIDRAAEFIPGLREHIVFCEASTPVTHERFTLASGGTSYGLELSIDQTGIRRPAPRTKIPGLFLTGASTFYTHGVGGTITGGLATAASIVGRDLVREVRSGRVFADPAKLTAGGPGWDPWMHSKPRAPARQRHGHRAEISISD